ncbi:hypothetical protein GOP47_0003284 [Adiantum capillus-veneris]|uniref:Uncharacterized protein n=1 Tax=Adiantum capillus-veneris TaxID=13818 RepID=A0A9D4VD88_ADICA|nr:hypothetical protein GOP47_0003284 [Adiantum capillus-veneris]
MVDALSWQTLVFEGALTYQILFFEGAATYQIFMLIALGYLIITLSMIHSGDAQDDDSVFRYEVFCMLVAITLWNVWQACCPDVLSATPSFIVYILVEEAGEGRLVFINEGLTPKCFPGLSGVTFSGITPHHSGSSYALSYCSLRSCLWWILPHPPLVFFCPKDPTR